MTGNNNVLVTFTNWSMIAAGDHPKETNVFNEYLSNERTWFNWKPTYRKVYTATKKSLSMCNKQGAPFGRMSEGGYKTQNPAVQVTSVELPVNKRMESIARYMNNLAGDVTNGGLVFEKYLENFNIITPNNTALSSTVRKQQE